MISEVSKMSAKNTEHVMTSIKKKYDISSDWTGSAYCGSKIVWDYANVTVDLSTSDYIKADLHKYQHPAPTHAEHAPHKWNLPVNCAKTQYVEDREDSPALSPKDANRPQQLGDTLLYYARVADPTLIVPVHFLASEQARAS
jgi:endonuclease I